ncbi:Pseudouridine-5'-phosphatase [Gaertneriomyces sp. JEL0708]|nr:Pseudouridine-5'-phosphatase [Gaertneriomyces sp. JEL0708]
MAAVTHCIFDMDGLLLDTERVYTEVTQEILDKYTPGKKFTWALKSRLMGTTSYESAKIIIEELALPLTIEDYLTETQFLQEKKWSSCVLLPGVAKLLRHLHKHGIPMALATSSTRPKMIQKSLNHQDVFSLFTSTTCGDDPAIINGKPAPDLFLDAQRKLRDPSAESCLVFEDALNGVKAAQAAGMRCIWIPDVNVVDLHGGTHDGVTEMLLSMEDFRPEKYGMPAFDE